MSLDFTAFFRTKPKSLPASHEGSGWVINIEAAIRIEAEDLAPGLLAMIGRRLWQVDLHLEGETRDASLAKLDEALAALIAADGVVYDPQREMLRDAEGERPVVALADLGESDEGFSLNILFNHADLVTPDRMAALLAILEEELPEALPHRYGTYEPPPHRWDQGGRDAFLARWDRQDAPFWIGKTPASFIYSAFDFKVTTRRPMFRAGRVDLQFRSKLAKDPAKLLAVLRVAEQFAVELDAFYVALIRGTDIHGPFWTGLIPTEHLLIILGRPLLDLWPEFATLSQPLGSEHRKAGGSDVGTVALRPPSALCYPSADEFGKPKSRALDGAYAELFPFAKSDPYV